jgi:small subunit ribosomal protein S17
MAKTLYGSVSSDKPDKTIVVTIRTRKTHPLYKKQYMVSKRMMAHDEKNEAKIGDRVSISETRPISAQKRFKLTKIIERPIIGQDQSVEAITELDTEIKAAKHSEAKAEPKPRIKKAKSDPDTEPIAKAEVRKK